MYHFIERRRRTPIPLYRVKPFQQFQSIGNCYVSNLVRLLFCTKFDSNTVNSASLYFGIPIVIKVVLTPIEQQHQQIPNHNPEVVSNNSQTTHV